MRFLERLQPLGLLGLRLILGAVLIAHGYTKVFGGLHRHVEVVQSLHLPGWLAYVSAFTEFGGGILLIVGFLTRVVALFVVVDMLVATFGIHFKNGFTGQGNYQFTLALAAIAFSLIFSGAGPIAIDWLTGGKGGR